MADNTSKDDDDSQEEWLNDMSDSNSEPNAQEEESVAPEQAEEKKDLGIEENKHHRFRRWFKEKWQSKWFRVKFFAGFMVLVLIILLIIPVTRYALLNLVGLRTRVVFVVRDGETKLPLVGADVVLGDVAGETNNEGRFIKDKMLHGKTQLEIKQPGFADVKQEVTLGFGPNVFDDFNLKTSGSRFSLSLVDRFSEKPVNGVEVSFGESTAVSDGEGLAELVIEPTSKKTIEVTIVGDDHAEKKYEIQTTAENQVIKLVPARRHYFISQRDGGDFGVYSVDLTGEDEKQLLEPTGDEEADISISVSPDGETGALISTRAGERNSDGYLLHNLDIINLETEDRQTIATAEAVRLIDWWDDRVVFTSIVAGSSAGNANRMKLRSYDVANDQPAELAKSNYFQDVLLVDGVVYYVPYDFKKDAVKGIRSIGVDGSNDRSIINSNSIYTLYRNRFDGIVYEVAEKSKWYSFDFDRRVQTTLPGRPANLNEINYALSPDKKQAAYVEKRDGKGTLLLTDIETGEDSVVLAKSGLKEPIQWLRGDLLVYRVDTEDESADYLLNLNDKKSTKLVDVYHHNQQGY